MKTRRLTVLTGALAVVLSVAACGPGDDTAVPGTQEETAAAAPADPSAAPTAHNEADVEFAQGMIVHHQGAVEMADVALEKASGDDVRALAQRISAAQGPEIEQMSGWLDAWGEEATPHADMGHGATDAGVADMDDLDRLSGAEFDRAFLELMIEHHEGAVAMARTELDDGAAPEATTLAQKIVADQTAEIAEMEQMLEGG